MKVRIVSRRYIFAIALLLPAGGVLAGGTGHSHGDPHGSHRHSEWIAPPAGYAARRHSGWDDAASAGRGEAIYRQNCLSCHGADGNGKGPAAAGLAHAPADLTNHFHTAPGQGDAYLFWRVSEGGMVEPFRGMKSAMPPFKTLLSEQEIWDVLTYVHQKFHGGFPDMHGQMHGATPANPGGNPHDDGGHAH